MENTFGTFVDYKITTRNNKVILLFDVLKNYPSPFEWMCAKEDFKQRMEELKILNKIVKDTDKFYLQHLD